MLLRFLLPSAARKGWRSSTRTISPPVTVCGYIYDPAEHDGVAFDELPDDWKCPRCKQPKEKFNKA